MSGSMHKLQFVLAVCADGSSPRASEPRTGKSEQQYS